MSAPCLKCGTATDNLITFAGLLDAKVFMCEPCFEPAFAEFEENRRQFQELIDAGMPRASANLVMIARMDEAEAERQRAARS